MRSLFPDAKKPNRNPGTPYDFDMLLMTIKCGYLFKSSLSNRESLFSGFAKSRKDSSMIKRIPFRSDHSTSANISFLDNKFPDGLSGLIIKSCSIALLSKKDIMSKAV